MTQKTKARIDPVCGMKVSPVNEADRFEHDGTEYLFCSTSCAEKFRADPTRYLHEHGEGTHHSDHSCCDHEARGDSAARPDGPKDAIYTCPMHPEVRQVGSPSASSGAPGPVGQSSSTRPPRCWTAGAHRP